MPHVSDAAHFFFIPIPSRLQGVGSDVGLLRRAQPSNESPSADSNGRNNPRNLEQKQGIIAGKAHK